MRQLSTIFRRPANEIRIRGGFAIHLEGAPLELVMPSNPVSEVALCGADYPGIRPEFRVRPGDRVRAGQTLFVDRKRPEIAFTAPAAGTVKQIRFGRRRVLDAAVISVEGEEAEEFRVNRDKPVEPLLASGLWTSFLTRPFGRIPDPGLRPEAILVTVIDTRPLAPDPMVAVEHDAESFRRGIAVLQRLTEGAVMVCHAPERRPVLEEGGRVRLVSIRGRHPAGLAGTQLHYLAPAAEGHVVWCIDYADVIAIGHLFTHGRLPAERIVAVAGSGMANPGLIRMRSGARLADIVAGEARDSADRILTGDPLSGRASEYLGRYHNQITVLEKGSAPEFGGLAAWLGRHLPGTASSTIVPMEILQRALPGNIPAVPLMRALSAGDSSLAHELGCLDLVEEDMALISRFCQTGQDYGHLLRRVLDDLATRHDR